MAGKLSFLLTIDGIPKAVGDVTALHNALKQLGGLSGGGLGGLGGVSGGADKASTGISKMAQVAGKAGREMQVLNAALGSKSSSFWEKNPHLKDAMSGGSSGKASGMSMEAAMLGLSSQRIMSQRANALQAGRDLDLNMRNQVKHFQALQASGMISAKQAIDWRMLGMGLAASPFSPWMGARAINSSGLLNAFGGGGGGGGLFGKLMGPGGFGGFLVAFTAVNVASKILKGAFDELAGAVKRGSDLFLKSAMLGTSISGFSHMSKVFQAIGLPAGAAERLMASGQFMKGSKSEFEGMMLGAGRGILSREELQGIRNLSGQISELWEQTAGAAKRSAQQAPALFREKIAIEKIKIEWQTLWEQMAAVMEPLVVTISKVVGLVGSFMNALDRLGDYLDSLNNFIVEKMLFPDTHGAVPWFDEMMHKLWAIGERSKLPEFQKFGGTGAQGQFNSWQRMGFVFSGRGGASDHAKQTAQNTAKIVKILEKSVTVEETTPGYDRRYNLP